MENLADKAREAIAQVNQVILGKEAIVEEVFLALLADGHVLLEDIPGVGKTSLALAFSRVMALDFHRVQFTPDVMPSDLTGFSIYRREEERFAYQPGSVFCHLLLADEINRASPKTQSALLEVMEERSVSVEGVTRQVPRPFLVIATENPMGSAGTQRLPEAQVDRFLIRAAMGYPDFEHELSLAMDTGAGSRLERLTTVMDREVLLEMQRAVHEVYLKEQVCRYLLQLVTATRSHPKLKQGASPRATLALVKMAKAVAWLHGKAYVTPETVAAQFPYVITHRIVMNEGARMDGTKKEQIIENILQTVKKPPMGEPSP